MKNNQENKNQYGEYFATDLKSYISKKILIFSTITAIPIFIWLMRHSDLILTNQRFYGDPVTLEYKKNQILVTGSIFEQISWNLFLLVFIGICIFLSAIASLLLIFALIYINKILENEPNNILIYIYNDIIQYFSQNIKAMFFPKDILISLTVIISIIFIIHCLKLFICLFC